MTLAAEPRPGQGRASRAPGRPGHEAATTDLPEVRGPVNQGGGTARGNQRLTRGRSRLSIGSGGVVYLMLTGVIAGAAVYTQANLLFWGTGLMGGGLAASLAWSWLSLRDLMVERVVPSTAAVGEPLVLRYVLRNPSWLPVFSIVLTETWGPGGRGWKEHGPVAQRPRRLKGRPVGWVLHLGSRQRCQAETMCWPLLRGDLALERLIVETAFPFGIVKRSVSFTGNASVLVYPQLYRLPKVVVRQASRADIGTGRASGRSGGMEEFVGLRPFREGDRLRDIEWKRTARTGRVTSRDYSHSNPPRVMVLLDLETASVESIGNREDAEPIKLGRFGITKGSRKKASEAEARATREGDFSAMMAERAISLAASVVCDAHLRGLRVGLAVRGGKAQVFGPHLSPLHRKAMLNALARLEVGERSTTTMPNSWRASVVVVTGSGHRLDARRDSRKPLVLGAADLHTFAQEVDASEVLGPPAAWATASRRGESIDRAGRASSHAEALP